MNSYYGWVPTWTCLAILNWGKPYIILDGKWILLPFVLSPLSLEFSSFFGSCLRAKLSLYITPYTSCLHRSRRVRCLNLVSARSNGNITLPLGGCKCYKIRGYGREGVSEPPYRSSCGGRFWESYIRFGYGLKDAGTGSVNAARWRTPLYESIKRPTSLVAYGILMKYLKAWNRKLSRMMGVKYELCDTLTRVYLSYWRYGLTTTVQLRDKCTPLFYKLSVAHIHN